MSAKSIAERLDFGSLCRAAHGLGMKNMWGSGLWEYNYSARASYRNGTQVRTVNLFYSMVFPEDRLSDLGDLSQNKACTVNPKEANHLFKHMREVHSFVADQARQVDDDIIRTNFETRFFDSLTVPQRQQFLARLRRLAEVTPFGEDPYGVGRFFDLVYTGEREDESAGYCLFAAACIRWCLSTSNTISVEEDAVDCSQLFHALPKDVTKRYDPYNLSSRHANHKAITIELVDGADPSGAVSFYNHERAVEYVLTRSLIIKDIQCSREKIQLFSAPNPGGYRLARVEAPYYPAVEKLIQQHEQEFRKKVSWSKPLSKMAYEGLSQGKWIAYAYFDKSGNIAAYLDEKLRMDGDIELGIQLTNSRDRRNLLATGLINFLRLQYINHRFFTGTYEENQRMRTILSKNGFLLNPFFNPKTKQLETTVAERVDDVHPGRYTNSVYYYANSLMTRVRWG